MTARILRFDGAYNFRDVGGLKTQDGSTMKPGMLFRSDELSQLSAEDLLRLEKLDLKLICDLRAPKERQRKVDRLPPHWEARVVNVPIFFPIDEWNRLQIFLALATMPANLDLAARFSSHYRAIAFERAAQFGEVVRLISDEDNLPALVHCASGKDRTGIFAALVQLLAGVAREAVLEDYLATNRFIGPRSKEKVKLIRRLSLFRLSPEHIAPMIEARREYLDGVLDEVLRRHSTVEEYLSEACGVERKRVIKLGRMLLE